VPRIPFLFAIASLLFAATTLAVGAQTPAAGGLQTVSGSSGYQYQVPSDWQQVPASLLERMGTQTFNIDGEVSSADGNQQAHVETATGFGITSANLSDALNAYFTAPSSSGGGAATVFAGPDPVQVPNADAGLSGAATYSDPNGAARVIDVRIAVRGQSTYLLALDMTQDFYQSNPNVNAILSSFRLGVSP
jgi:hypothetical protein